MKRKVYLGLWMLIPLFVVGQTTDSTSTQGEIITGEVVIEKDKQIILPKADKLYQKGELKSFGEEKLSIQLTTFEPTLNWPPYKSDVPFAFKTGKYPASEYPNYVRLGYGNFGSPLFEAGIFQKLGAFNTRSKLFYESFKNGPVNDDLSGNSTGMIDLSGTYQKKGFSITPYVNYQNRQYRFYGNTDSVNTGFIESDSSKVNWNEFNIGLAIEGAAGDIRYRIKPDFRTTGQKFKDGTDINSERVISASAGLEYQIDKKFISGFDIGGYSASYDGGITYDRSLFQLTPWISYSKEEITLKGGIAINTGKSGQVSNSGVYPLVEGQWDFADNWSLYANFMGGIEWNGLSNLLAQNEFLDDSLAILNTETTSSFGGGIKGAPVKNMLIDLSLTISNLDNLPIMIPSVGDSARFMVTYDGDVINRVTFKGSLTYTPTNVSTYGASLAINSYSMETLDRPWHLPALEFEAYTSHNINEKLIASVSVLGVSGIKAPANVAFGIQNLDSFLDLGLGMNYLITKRASAFINVRNLLNNEYQRYIGYPVRGLNFKIGGQYRF